MRRQAVRAPGLPAVDGAASTAGPRACARGDLGLKLEQPDEGGPRGIQLSICPSCHRHIRESEASCPFCGRVIGRQEAKGRLGRAAICAISLGTATILPACSSSSPMPVFAYGPAPEIECGDAGLASSCTGQHYTTVAHCADCDGGQAYALCYDSTYVAFTCSPPEPPWTLAGDAAAGGEGGTDGGAGDSGGEAGTGSGG